MFSGNDRFLMEVGNVDAVNIPQKDSKVFLKFSVYRDMKIRATRGELC